MDVRTRECIGERGMDSEGKQHKRGCAETKAAC